MSNLDYSALDTWQAEEALAQIGLPRHHWAFEPASKSLVAGILVIRDGRIEPSAPLTNAGLASVMARLVEIERGKDLETVLILSGDRTLSSRSAQDDLQTAISEGLLPPPLDGDRLDPEGVVTRYELARSIHRFFQFMKRQPIGSDYGYYRGCIRVHARRRTSLRIVENAFNDYGGAGRTDPSSEPSEPLEGDHEFVELITVIEIPDSTGSNQSLREQVAPEPTRPVDLQFRQLSRTTSSWLGQP